jgi:hypothetical protein
MYNQVRKTVSKEATLHLGILPLRPILIRRLLLHLGKRQIYRYRLFEAKVFSTVAAVLFRIAFCTDILLLLFSPPLDSWSVPVDTQFACFDQSFASNHPSIHPSINHSIHQFSEVACRPKKTVAQGHGNDNNDRCFNVSFV